MGYLGWAGPECGLFGLGWAELGAFLARVDPLEGLIWFSTVPPRVIFEGSFLKQGSVRAVVVLALNTARS